MHNFLFLSGNTATIDGSGISIGDWYGFGHISLEKDTSKYQI